MGGGKTAAQRRHGNRRMGQEDPAPGKEKGGGAGGVEYAHFLSGKWLWLMVMVMFRGFVLTDHGNYGKIDAPCKKSKAPCRHAVQTE